MKRVYPVNRISEELEREWAAALAKRFGQEVVAFLASPTRFMQYPIEVVRIELMDGSQVEFKYAFALVSEELKTIAVFTEHCGHHAYPYHEAKVYQAGQLVYPNEAQPLAQAERQRQATRPGPVVLRIFSPARAWHPAVVARLARTLGRTNTILCTPSPAGMPEQPSASPRARVECS